MMQLYDYQIALERGIFDAYRRGRNAVCTVLPTGGGKTLVAASLVSKVAAKGKRVYLLAHRRELVGQLSAALERADIRHGLIRPDCAETGDLVQVCMVQTLARRIKLDKSGRYYAGGGLVVVDECHHAVFDNQWGDVLRHLGCGDGSARLLGLTATPCRLDGKGLGADSGGFFDCLVQGPTVEELIAKGRLSPFVVYQPATGLDLSGVAVRRGDYVSSQLAEAVEKARIDPVPRYRELLQGAPSIAFTIDIKESEAVRGQFQAAGYSAAVLTGKTPDRERLRLLRDLGRGGLNVLASCNVISEGTDVPEVVGALLLRPTASLSLDWQQKGRVLRVLPGKERAIILDYVGNSTRHGIPTDPVSWSLDGLGNAGTGSTGKNCFRCLAWMPNSAKRCPGCGMEIVGRPADPAQARLDLEPVNIRDVNLVELTPEIRAAIRANRERAERMARSVDDLAVIRDAMGYRPGWERHRARELGIGRRATA